MLFVRNYFGQDIDKMHRVCLLLKYPTNDVSSLVYFLSDHGYIYIPITRWFITGPVETLAHRAGIASLTLRQC